MTHEAQPNPFDDDVLHATGRTLLIRITGGATAATVASGSWTAGEEV
jgi:hypothetical protein